MAGVMGAAILGIIIFIVIPLLQPPDTTGRSPTDTFQTQSVPANSVPASTTTVPATMLPSYAVAAFSATTVYRSGTAYDQVFARDYSFEKPRQEVFTHTLQQSPMIVECEMNPEMVSREQLVDIGTANERYITSVYANPAAYLDLKVINTDTGGVITTISFSKNYRGELKQTYTIRSNGNYRFELIGNLVSPVVRLLVKK
jgi:hypothetical protein